jgi:MoaA/NifB/PqqE/SkfB family radical SAM enzyme/glycosyltransferase involved in cell wall biosynthesis
MDISIVIPTYNRKLKLKACLESLFRQDYPQDVFEIIVIDDGSTDGTKYMVEEFSRINPNLRYFNQKRKGPAAARNLGIKNARAQIVGFTDSDCILDKDWVKAMVRAHSLDKQAAAVGGFTEVDSRNIKALVSQFLSDGAIQTPINGKTETIFFPTCNVSFKRDYLACGFNELFPLPAGEDLDFFWRLFKNGGRFRYQEDIKVFHDCHPGLFSFLKQAYMYGRGNYLVQHMHRDHPLLKEVKVKNSPIFLCGLAVNFIKIPRFTALLGKRLIQKYNRLSLYEKAQVYLCFALHKINYLCGNLSEHIRAKKITAQDPLKPELIILDMTHRCNLLCNICEIRKDKPIEEFTLEEVKKIIGEAFDWQVEDFALSGGEPLIREDIFEILDFVREKGYHVGALTNGVILNDNFINRLLPYLAGGYLSLSISLDALTPGIHDEIRGVAGSFEKTSGALKKLSGLKKEYPAVNFNSISIILNENLEELLDLAVFLKSLNVNSIQFQPLLVNNLIMTERGKGAKYWILPERFPVLDETIDRLVDFQRKNPGLVRNSENNLDLMKKYFRGALTQGDVKCLNAAKTMLIANSGEVTTCFESYGNVRKNSLKEIYASKESRQARERVKGCKHPCLLPCFCD